MFYQKEVGLYVYQCNDNFSIKHRYYRDFDELFSDYRRGDESFIDHFGYDLYKNLNRDQDRLWGASDYTKLLFDESGGFYCPSAIKGLFREWLAKQQSCWQRYIKQRRHNRRYHAWCRQRGNINCINELRLGAVSDEDYVVRVRSKRYSSLIKAMYRYEDYGFHSGQKSWKKQSKRMRQHKRN